MLCCGDFVTTNILSTKTQAIYLMQLLFNEEKD
jgi:hypothetical protein